MTSDESRNDTTVVVLTDLVAISKKLAENSAVPEDLRARARQFVEEFNSLLPYLGKATPSQHCEAEELLQEIALFLPRVIVVEPWSDRQAS